MALIRKSHIQGEACFDEIKRIRSINELRAKLQHDMALPENQRTSDLIAAE
jgi:tRNA-dihydrouridine synthase C